jgi:hypothetical protein
MPINPNIPLQAANIPQIRYQPESQFESFAKIQPTLNAMQQMRTQAVESQEKARGQQVLQKMRADLGPNFDPEQVGLYLLKNGANQAQMQLGLNLYKASQDEKASQRPAVVAPGSALISPAGKELYRAPVDQKPKLEKVQLGDRITFVDVNPSSPTFQQEVMSQAMGAAPGAAEARGPEIVQLMRARDALPAGSPDRALVQARIDKLNAPSSGVTIQMPVPVYDSKTGQTTYVTREEAIGKTPASVAPTALTPSQLIKRRDTIAEEYKSASNALQVTQDVLDSATQVKESEGLSRATGFTGTMLPSFPGGQAAFAETRLKNLKGKVTALGKAAAASTGSIGQIANQEWKILADQIAAIEEIKGAEPLLEQIGLLEAQAQGAMRRIKDAYQKQFGEDFERFPQFSTLLEPKSVLKRAPQGRGPAPVESAPSAGNTVTLPDGRVMNFPNAAAAAAFKKAAGL